MSEMLAGRLSVVLLFAVIFLQATGNVAGDERLGLKRSPEPQGGPPRPTPTGPTSPTRPTSPTPTDPTPPLPTTPSPTPAMTSVYPARPYRPSYDKPSQPEVKPYKRPRLPKPKKPQPQRNKSYKPNKPISPKPANPKPQQPYAGKPSYVKPSASYRKPAALAYRPSTQTAPPKTESLDSLRVTLPLVATHASFKPYSSLEDLKESIERSIVVTGLPIAAIKKSVIEHASITVLDTYHKQRLVIVVAELNALIKAAASVPALARGIAMHLHKNIRQGVKDLVGGTVVVRLTVGDTSSSSYRTEPAYASPGVQRPAKKEYKGSQDLDYPSLKLNKDYRINKKPVKTPQPYSGNPLVYRPQQSTAGW